jgi:hypothetical protein
MAGALHPAQQIQQAGDEALAIALHRGESNVRERQLMGVGDAVVSLNSSSSSSTLATTGQARDEALAIALHVGESNALTQQRLALDAPPLTSALPRQPANDSLLRSALHPTITTLVPPRRLRAIDVESSELFRETPAAPVMGLSVGDRVVVEYTWPGHISDIDLVAGLFSVHCDDGCERAYPRLLVKTEQELATGESAFKQMLVGVKKEIVVVKELHPPGWPEAKRLKMMEWIQSVTTDLNNERLSNHWPLKAQLTQHMYWKAVERETDVGKETQYVLSCRCCGDNIVWGPDVRPSTVKNHIKGAVHLISQHKLEGTGVKAATDLLSVAFRMSDQQRIARMKLGYYTGQHTGLSFQTAGGFMELSAQVAGGCVWEGGGGEISGCLCRLTSLVRR